MEAVAVQLNMPNVLSQVYSVLQYLPDELLTKIPDQIRENIFNLKSTSYNFEYDETKELVEQDIFEESKDMISALYLTYMCGQEKKNELLEVCKQNDKTSKLYEKYNYEDIFEKNQKQNDVAEDIEDIEDLKLVEVKENIFVRIINWIKELFD